MSPCSLQSKNSILFVLALGGFILGLTEFAMMPMLPLFSEAFSATPAQSSYAISAYALGVVVGAPVFMLLTANIRKRQALMLFVAMMLVFNGLGALAQTLEQLVLSRFLSGLPHGSYFGTAAIMAAEIAPRNKRVSYISKVFMGLTIATIIGVPLVTLIGQNLSWRYCLALVSFLSLLAFLLMFRLPNEPNKTRITLANELEVFKSGSVWSIIAMMIVGFGGIFCIYTYVADTILKHTQAPAYAVSIAMVMFGIGSTVGNVVLGKIGNRHPVRTTGVTLALAALFSLLYVFVSSSMVLLCVVVFFIGCTIGLAAIVQSLLMEAAPNGQAMIGAIVQCSFNTANAIGPWVGGIYIAAGGKIHETGYVAAILFAGGFVIWAASAKLLTRKQEPLAVEPSIAINN